MKWILKCKSDQFFLFCCCFWPKQFLNQWNHRFKWIPKSLFIYLDSVDVGVNVNRSRKCFNDDGQLVDWLIDQKWILYLFIFNGLLVQFNRFHHDHDDRVARKNFRKIFVKHIDIFSDFFGFGRWYVSLWLSVRVQKNKVDWLIFIQSKKIQNENFGFWCDDDDHFSN